mmetsp:Transcript_4555/g.6127  ORF Transcript_4555/g.6127 Transcript_4555/m.6127 type:complete len:228 (-) Transcript_4555:165-848(-)
MNVDGEPRKKSNTRKRRRTIEDEFSALAINVDMLTPELLCGKKPGHEDYGNAHMETSTDMSLNSDEDDHDDDLSVDSDLSAGSAKASSRDQDVVYRLVFGNGYHSGKNRKVGHLNSMRSKCRVDDRIEEIIRTSRLKIETFVGSLNNVVPNKRNESSSPMSRGPPVSEDLSPNLTPATSPPRHLGMPSHSEFISAHDKVHWDEKWSTASLGNSSSCASVNDLDDMDF